MQLIANSKKAKTIAITDSNISPLLKFADLSLISRSDMVSFVDSLVAPFSVVNALIAALGMKHREEISKTFKNLENIWEEYEVYDKIQKNDGN